MVHPDIQAVRDAWNAIAKKCRTGEVRTRECVEALYNAFDMTNDLEAYFMLFKGFTQAPWITFLWPVITLNAWMILFMNLVEAEPVFPQLAEIDFTQRNEPIDELYDVFLFYTWSYFEPVAFFSTQFFTRRTSDLRSISPFYMSKDNISLYFFCEALVLPLYASTLATLQTLFFWWSYPLIFLGRAFYGEPIIEEYGFDTYWTILFSLQRYQIFLDFFFFNPTL